MNHQFEEADSSWSVKTEKETIVLNPNTLLDLLLGKVYKVEKRDFNVLLQEFLKFLNSTDKISSMTIMQIATLSFSIGYYYKLFLEKNEVEITITNKD